MTDRTHPDSGRIITSGDVLRELHEEIETLRMGYAAARLGIESLKAQLAERAKEHADELTVAYMCGASREKELAAQQPGAAGLIGALEDAQRAINSMKVEAETAAQGDEQMMLEACDTISNEGLQADMAIRAALASHGQAPAGATKPTEQQILEAAFAPAQPAQHRRARAMNKPTDAEIIALADETRTGEPGRGGYILPISFARAVLARWGQPAHSGEPLTHAQAKALVLKYGNDPLHLVYQVEVAHGIKGGQRGTD